MRIGRNLAEQAQHVLQAANSLGLNVSPSSRLGRMARLYAGPDGTPAFIATTEPGFAIAREGIRDMLQFAFILDEVGSSESMTRMLKRALGDAALPQEDVSHTPRRDTQCELYVAAICAKAGMNPRFEEPDVQCRCADKDYGLAVKRLKSLKKFDDRFDKGIDQVKRSGIAGVIVIYLTLAMNPQNLPITLALSDHEYGQMTMEDIRRYIESRFLRLAEEVRGPGVLGLILLVHDIRLRAGNWGMDSITMGTHLSPFNSRRQREFQIFFEQFKRGLATASISPTSQAR